MIGFQLFETFAQTFSKPLEYSSLLLSKQAIAASIKIILVQRQWRRIIEYLIRIVTNDGLLKSL